MKQPSARLSASPVTQLSNVETSTRWTRFHLHTFRFLREPTRSGSGAHKTVEFITARGAVHSFDIQLRLELPAARQPRHHLLGSSGDSSKSLSWLSGMDVIGV